MDIHWGNNAIKVLILLALSFILIGCKSKKTISDKVVTESVERTERVETVVIKEPYKIEAKETIHFDTIGKITIKPMKISIQKDDIVGEVIIENNEVKYSLEKKDTTIVSKEIKENTVTDIKTDRVTEVEVKKSFFQRISDFSNNILIFALIVGLLYLAYRLIKKFFLPL